MDELFNVFVVEDDASIQHLLDEVLSASCSVELVASAEDCLTKLSDAKPDLFLVDVGLPGMDGTQLCRRLKDDFETAQIPVVIVSGQDSDEARLAAYDAGAHDFIVKPFKATEVSRKVQVVRRLLDERRQLRDQAGYAQRTAFSAMTANSELGVVMQFLRNSFACALFDDVAHSVLDSVGQYELNAAVQIRAGGLIRNVSPQGYDVPLEGAILDHMSTMGRIYSFKNRCIFNYPRMSILVRNMPLEDADRCGRIRDNVAMLAEGADARLAAIEVEQSNQRQREGALRALEQVRTTIDALRESNKQDRIRCTTVMEELLVELERSFVSLGLSESQEVYLQQLVKGYAEVLIGIQLRDNQTEAQLKSLATVLATITE